jgi:hypothetical protein
MNMRLRTWNAGSLYRAGSLKTVASELSNYSLDLVAIQKVRWFEGGSQPAYDYTFFYGNINANHHLVTGFFIHKEIS